MRLKLTTLCIAFVASTVWGSDAFAKEVSAIVISDSSLTFKSVQIIAPNDLLVLAAGEKLSIALSSGKTKTIEGPFSGNGNELSKSSSKVKSWRKLLADLTQREGPSNIIGGVRDINNAPILYLDDVPSYVYCIYTNQRISTERNERPISIKSAKTGISISLPIKREVLWPRFFDRNDKYLVRTAANGAAQLDVKIIQSYSLAELNENECTHQYENKLAQIILGLEK